MPSIPSVSSPLDQYNTTSIPSLFHARLVDRFSSPTRRKIHFSSQRKILLTPGRGRSFDYFTTLSCPPHPPHPPLYPYDTASIPSLLHARLVAHTHSDPLQPKMILLTPGRACGPHGFSAAPSFLLHSSSPLLLFHFMLVVPLPSEMLPLMTALRSTRCVLDDGGETRPHPPHCFFFLHPLQPPCLLMFITSSFHHSGTPHAFASASAEAPPSFAHATTRKYLAREPERTVLLSSCLRTYFHTPHREILSTWEPRGEKCAVLHSHTYSSGDDHRTPHPQTNTFTHPSTRAPPMFFTSRVRFTRLIRIVRVYSGV